jgi:hypothetical protein
MDIWCAQSRKQRTNEIQKETHFKKKYEEDNSNAVAKGMEFD